MISVGRKARAQRTGATTSDRYLFCTKETVRRLVARQWNYRNEKQRRDNEWPEAAIRYARRVSRASLLSHDARLIIILEISAAPAE